MKCIMGIDPGLSGALAFYYPASEMGEVVDVPLRDGIIDPGAVRMVVEYHNPQFAVIERVHSMPKQGVRSTFNFGYAAGTLFGVVGSNLRTILVTPRAWKIYWGLDKDKEKARALAIDLLPKSADRLMRKKDHNRAEALLIALYGARTLK